MRLNRLLAIGKAKAGGQAVLVCGLALDYVMGCLLLLYFQNPHLLWPASAVAVVAHQEVPFFLGAVGCAEDKPACVQWREEPQQVALSTVKGVVCHHRPHIYLVLLRAAPLRRDKPAVNALQVHIPLPEAGTTFKHLLHAELRDLSQSIVILKTLILEVLVGSCVPHGLEHHHQPQHARVRVAHGGRVSPQHGAVLGHVCLDSRGRLESDVPGMGEAFWEHLCEPKVAHRA
mmetsp:Transcript_25626/g.71656  ORF Transcript_25626/g.71656 Transcript_25626/m.71656 type:complete len:231 (-) Transcript_25626:510-1202(-)